MESTETLPDNSNDQLIRRLQTELCAAKNQSWRFASFEKCVTRLRELGSSPAKINRGIRALELVDKGKRPDFATAYAHLCKVDKDGPPAK